MHKRASHKVKSLESINSIENNNSNIHCIHHRSEIFKSRRRQLNSRFEQINYIYLNCFTLKALSLEGTV